MKTNQEKLEARVSAICQDLFARKESPESAKAKIMALMSTPPIALDLIQLPAISIDEAIRVWKAQGILIYQSGPKLKPLKWEETRLHQSVMCPNSNGRYSLEGTDEGWHCEFIPAKGITRHEIEKNAERGVAIAAIEEHRNSKLKENLQ